ncbi:MAG: hypothetical protein ACUVX8_05060 [Candidatus Zipacnadales bacterium]
MEGMREIVELKTVEAAIQWGGGIWFGMCLLVGLVLMKRLHQALWLQRACHVGLIGPLVIGLWWFYSWMVRFDPETGYFGLDKVWVMAVSALLFVVVGAAYGFSLGRLWHRSPPAEGKAANATNEQP